MLIPLADSLNHENVCVDYQTVTQDFLKNKSRRASIMNDYTDFLNTNSCVSRIMGKRSHKNRLEKYLAYFEDDRFSEISAVWELDNILCKYESSTDEEDQVHRWTSEESSESSGEDFDLYFDPEGKFFTMKTKEKGSFKEGEQVFACYGRLNNFDLLLDYGFALLPNRYDSYFLRMHKHQLFLPTSRKVRAKTFILKDSRLNLKLLEYLRRKFGKKSVYGSTEKAAEEEIKIVTKYKNLIKEVLQRYPTLLEYDLELLENIEDHRKIFAISKG